MLLSRPDPSSDVLRKSRSDLRLCCAICVADADTARELVRSSKDGVDWMGLIEVARSHRLEMLLYRAASSHFVEFVDPSALTALRRCYDDNHARGLALTTALLQLLAQLDGAQIPALPFKGPVLGAQLYGDIALRVYSDLDVLVRERDAERATRIMIGQGYRQGAMSLGWERSFERDGASVDLHWSIADKVHQFPLTADELVARRTTVMLAGTPVSTLCAQDALLAICFNGLSEDWQRCDRIADVAELVRSSGSTIDWPGMLALCRRRGCERLVLVGLHLAKELFRVTLPHIVELRLQSHRRALARAGYAIDDFLDFTITSTDRRRGGNYWRHILRMRERQWEKVPYYQSFAYDLFKPKDDDAAWQRGSRRLLYSVLRLPLLGAKQSLRALGHATLRETDTRP